MFKSKINLLMNDKGIKNLNELSITCEIPYSTLKRIYKSNAEHTEKINLKKIADFFDCTIDYLVDDKISIDNKFHKYKSNFNIWQKTGINNDNKEKILDKIPTEIYKYLELDYWYHPNEEEINKGINDYSNDYILFNALISMGLLEEGIELTEDILKNIIDFILLNVTIIKNLLCKEKEKFLKTIKK